MDAPVEAQRQAVIGLDEHMTFQHREWWWQRVGRVFLAVFVLAACSGVFGGIGPLNTSNGNARDGSLSVEYQRFIRAGMLTTLRLTVANPGAEGCLISNAVFDEMQIERIAPEPTGVVRQRDAVRLRFAAPLAVGATVTIDAVPTGPGRIEGWAALAGHEPVTFRPLAIF